MKRFGQYLDLIRTAFGSMKILQVNKFLYRKAGAEAYVFTLSELLTQKGHHLALWGTNAQPMIHDSRFMIHENLLVDYLNFDKRGGPSKDLRKVGHMIWSWESARKFEQMLCEFKPDVVHIHNIYHHISPSILPVAARYKVPVVMTVHDWHLINPNYNLFDHGEICKRNGLAAIAHRCIKNSYAASLADVLEWRIHKWMRVYAKCMAKFIVPNEFVKRKLVAGGVEMKKIEVVPLTVRSARLQPRLSDPKGSHYILFSGRLTVEKGIYVLLEMAKQLPEIKFKIAGTGPEELGIMNYELGNVELLGFVEKERLQKIIAGARMVIVPSLWEELSPLSVLEAMAAGKVVVASKIGGIAELIQNGETGVLVEGDWVDPVRSRARAEGASPSGTAGAATSNGIDTIRKLYYDEPLLKKVGRAAAEYVKRVHSPEKHYEKIMEIYHRAISY